jgi:type IV pilus assembly protein PilA
MERMLGKKLSQMRNAEGFTLVELMVVVAIIGILATLAVPQYKKFQAKSRQSEARLSLGGAYTIEQSFAAENSSYTMCLGQAGYARDGVRFYYTIGFNIDDSNKCGPNGGLNCNFTGWEYDSATQSYANQGTAECNPAATNMGIFPATAAENAEMLNGVDPKERLSKGNADAEISQQAFVIGASGSILSGGVTGLAVSNPFDGWTIDQNKQLKNVLSGLSSVDPGGKGKK